MEIMELSTKMESMNIVKMQPTLQAVLDKGQNFSPRVTRSRSVSYSDESSSPKTQQNLPSTTRKRKRPSTENDIEKFYLNKKVTLVHKSLETIYEDPILKKGSTLFIGTSKVKRSLLLDREFRITTKHKSKMRKMKIKRLGTKAKKCKISDEEFINKLISIESDINNDEDNGNVEDNRNVDDKNRHELQKNEEKIWEEVEGKIHEDEKIFEEDEGKVHEDEKILTDELALEDKEELPFS